MAIDPSMKADLLVEQLKEDTTEHFNENINELVKKLSGKFQEIKKSLLDEFDSRLMQLPDVTDEVRNLRSEFEAKLQNLEKEDIGTIQTQMQDMVSQEIDSDTNLKEEFANKIEEVRQEFLRKLANLGGGSQNQRIQIEGTVMSTRYADFNLKGSGVSITGADNNTTKQVDITFTATGISIGGTITGGTAGSILFINPNNILAQDNANLFWDDTNNILGIGTNTFDTETLKQQINATTVITSGVRQTVRIVTTVTPPSSSSAGIEGLRVYTQATGNQNITGAIYGSIYSVQNNGTGTVTAAYGFQGLVETSAGGTLTNGVGMAGRVSGSASGGTITNGYAIQALTPNMQAGTLVNAYGLYVEDQNVGTTLNYAIYTNAGLVRFGGAVTGAATIDATTGYKQNNLATSGSYLRGNGTNIVLSTLQAGDLPVINGRFLSRTVKTSGTSYTTPAGCTKILVQLIGGGAGGGGAGGGIGASGAGGGGGSGSYAEKVYTVVASTAYTIAIGAAGTGGANTGGNGNVGGATTFTDGVTLVTANGGLGGIGMAGGSTILTALGGNGGAVSTNGDFNAAGTPGVYGIRFSATVEVSGSGGSTLWGGGGNGTNANGSGNAGGVYGSGGSGGVGTAAGGNVGSDGAAGVMIIWEFS